MDFSFPASQGVIHKVQKFAVCSQSLFRTGCVGQQGPSSIQNSMQKKIFR